MTIDERLERLTERHEALTPTLEHLARQGEEQNSRIDRLIGGMELLVEVVREHEHRVDGLEPGRS